jgi:hypothetical protein
MAGPDGEAPAMPFERATDEMVEMVERTGLRWSGCGLITTDG